MAVLASHRVPLIKLLIFLGASLRTSLQNLDSYTIHNVDSTTCYASKLNTFSHSDAIILCRAATEGGYLLAFNNYLEFQVFQSMDFPGSRADTELWMHLDRCTGRALLDLYCWRQGGNVESGAWAPKRQTVNTGSGCVFLTNDVPASVDDVLWMAEEACNQQKELMCRIPCPNSDSMEPLIGTTDGQVVSIDLNQTVTLYVTRHDPSASRFDWYLGGQLVQSHSSTYQVDESNSRRLMAFVLVQENNDGGYVRSDTYSLLQTEKAGLSINPVQPVYRNWEMPVLQCSHPSDVVPLSFSWYRRTIGVSQIWNSLAETGSNITVIYSANADEYVCTYVITDGESPLSDIVSITYVNAPVKPDITSSITATSISLNLNTPITLYCNSNASVASSATYNWYTDNSFTETTSSNSRVTTSSVPGLFAYTCNVEEMTAGSYTSDPIEQYFEIPVEYMHVDNGYCYRILNSIASRDDHQTTCQSKADFSQLLPLHSSSEFAYLQNLMNEFVAGTSHYDFFLGNNHTTAFMYGDGTFILPYTANDTLMLTNSPDVSTFTLVADAGGPATGMAICKEPCASGVNLPAVSASAFVSAPGVSITLECSWTLGGVYAWAKNKEMFSENSASRSMDVICATASRHEYQCLTTEPDGQYMISPAVTIITIANPTLTSTPHDIMSYSTGTPVTLTCEVKADDPSATLTWYRAFYATPLATGGTLELDTSETSSFEYRCEYTVPNVGTSHAKRFITVYAGPAMPNTTISPTTWTHYGSPVNVTCDNVTVLVEGWDRPYYTWFLDDQLEVGMQDSPVLNHTAQEPSIVEYQCAVTDAEGTSTISLPTMMIFAVLEMCNPSFCQNFGTCYARTTNISGCICSPGFEGNLCERVIAIRLAQTEDFTNATTATSSVDDIWRSIDQDLMNDFTPAMSDRIMMSTEAIVIYGDRMLDDHDSIDYSLSYIAEGTMAHSEKLRTIMKKINCSDDLAKDALTCSQNNSQRIIHDLQQAIDSVGTTALLSNPAPHLHEVVHSNGMTMTLGKMSGNQSDPVVESVGAKVELPPSLMSEVGAGSSVLLVSTLYDVDPYFHSSSTSISVFGPVYNMGLRDDKGNPVPVPPEDPLRLSMKPADDTTSHVLVNMTKVAMHQVDVIDPLGSVLVVEFSVASTQTLTLVGRKDQRPSVDQFDFNVTVVEAGNVDVSNNNGDFTFTYHSGMFQVHKAFPNCSAMYFWTTYDDSSVLANKTDVVISLVSYFYTVNFWQDDAISWIRAPSAFSQGPSFSRRRLLSDTNNSVTLLSIEPDGQLTFSSSIFSSFSVSRFVVMPNTINFDEIFANFSSRLLDSPHVLAVNCILLFAALLVLLYLRRKDKADSLMWLYLPLVDNDDRDEWVYTLSVHTSIDSPVTMTALPFFILKGKHGRTYIRLLSDGHRQNFTSGTLSNFMLRTPHWLGELRAIKIWTDGRGEQPEWQLNRIVIKDVAKNTSYLFVCQEWLALSKGDGQLCREIPAFQPPEQGASLSGDVNIVSKQMLYNDHLWLSIAKRPSYSTFTRVQRFCCAMSLLFLSMLTSAMFFETGEDQGDAQETRLKMGVIEIGYREFYVGIVSAVIIVIPGVILTSIFTKRKLRVVTYEHKPPQQTLSLPTVPATSWPPSMDQKTSAALFSEAGGVNDSINFLKNVFKAFEHQRDPNYAEDTLDDPPAWHSQSASHRSSIELPIEMDKDEETLAPGATKRESCNVKEKTPFMFPWWTIFLAYALMILVISGSAFLTFFYSLQWGGSVSTKWLLSIFFSTSASTFFIEPLKILCVGLLLSYLFQRFAVRDLSEVAPFEKCKTVETPTVPLPEIVHEPDTDTKLMKKRKQDLKLKHKFVDFMTGMGIKVLMVVLTAIVVLHVNVSTGFYQNAQVERILGEEHLINNVTKDVHVYSWLKRVVIPRAMPSTLYNGIAMSPYQERFTVDQDHYRLGPIRILQFRVKDSNECDVRSKLSGYIKSIRCWGVYGSDTIERANFTTNWTSCSSPCPSHYTYTSGARWGMGMLGWLHTYGPGGYQALLADSQRLALDMVDALRTGHWINEQTRGILAELTVFNPNTQLFTQGKALLEMPSFGGVLKTVKVKSANLYPYTTVWDYFVLLFMMIFGIVEIAMLVHVITGIIRPSEGEGRMTCGRLVSLFEIILALTALATYMARVVLTTQLLEDVINDHDTFTSFDTVFLLDEIYSVCMCLVLFVRVVLCLSPLSLNYHLFVMRRTLAAALPQLRGFMFMLKVFLLSFAMYFTVLRGHATRNLSSVHDSFTTMLTVFLGHGKYRGVGGETEMAASSGFDDVAFRIMYGVFCFGSAILMINMAVTILSTYLTDVKKACASNYGRHPDYDARLNEFVWARLDSFIKRIIFYVAKHAERLQHSGRLDNSASLKNERIRKGRFF